MATGGAMTGTPVTRRPAFRLIMLSAVLVTGLRLGGPYEVTNDQGTQLEAAERFASGLGITTTNHSDTPSALCEPASARTLVWFPPGYSVLVGTFLYAGASLLLTLKVIGAAGTLVGWFGWALLIAHVLFRPIAISGRRLPVHLFLACSLPVLMTPQWNRTDLFLWAGIPYFILLLTNYFRVRPSWACVMAAALAGIEIAIRYASAFLIPAGVLLIVQATWPDRRELIRRVGIFVGVLAVAAFPVVVVLIGTMQHFSQVPAGAMIAYLATLEPADAAWFIISRLPGISNLVFGGPQVMQSVLRLHSQALSTAFGIGCLIVVLTCPFLLWKRHTGSAENRKADLAISFSLISLSLILFLSIAGFGSYFSVNRYFLPLLYLPLLIAYQIASSASGAPAALSRVVLAICVASYLSSFMMLFSENRKWMATYSVVGLRAAAQTTSLPIRYTRPVLFSRVENTRQQVIALSRLYPEANFFAQQYGYFIYDGLAGGPAPGDRFRPIPSRGSLAKMTGCGPQRIFWVVATDRDFDLVPASMQRVTFEDRIERMRIVETYLPAGYQFRF